MPRGRRVGIFQRKTLRGFHAELIGSHQKGIGIGFASRVVAMRDHGMETIEQAVGGEMMLRVLAARGCCDGTGQLQFVQEIE